MGLVIRRKAQEAVEIRTPAGECILVRVISIVYGETRLLFEAPKDCIIHREEVWERMDEESRQRQPATVPEGARVVCQCECGGTVLGVDQSGQTFTVCDRCSPKVPLT